MNMGWQCPQCGKCNAPWVAACDHGIQLFVSGIGQATPCEHAWITDTSGTHCEKCGFRSEAKP